MAAVNVAELSKNSEVQWNPKLRLPTDRYTVRYLNEEFGPSKSSGNPMITRESEIVYPDTVMIGGRKVIIAGAKVSPQYFPTIVLENGTKNDEKSAKALQRLIDEDAKLGITYESIDPENPTLQAKGILAEVILGCEEYVRRKDLTAEDRAAGKKQGEPILDEDGKAIVSYAIKIQEVLRKSTREINRPF